jgi:hypothetical protein
LELALRGEALHVVIADPISKESDDAFADRWQSVIVVDLVVRWLSVGRRIAGGSEWGCWDLR